MRSCVYRALGFHIFGRNRAIVKFLLKRAQGVGDPHLNVHRLVCVRLWGGGVQGVSCRAQSACTPKDMRGLLVLHIELGLELWLAASS